MARTALSMTRLAEALDDQTFQISALTKRIKELEEKDQIDDNEHWANDYGEHSVKNRVRWLLDRVKRLENERSLDRKSYESTYRDIIKRIRELERIAHTAPITSDNPPQSEREKITEVIHDITQALVRIEKIIGTHGG